MFLPLKTEAHDGRFRLGAIGIVVACALVHILVWRDQARRADRVRNLDREVMLHQAKEQMAERLGKQAEDLLSGAGGDGVFGEGSQARARDTLAANPERTLQSERKASLFYRLALVRDDFNPVNLITYMFTHADILHFLFNMWFFYLVGVTMEKYWGTGKFVGLYLACGILAAVGFLAVSSGAKARGVPMVGASGAIAAMMGAFAITHGDAKVTMMWFFGFRGGTFRISARVYLAFWIAGQLLEGVLDAGKAGGTAYSAHIVGFLAGLAIGKKIPADVFYRKAYAADDFAAAVDRIVSQDKLDVPAEAPFQAQVRHQAGTGIVPLLDQARNAWEQGNASAAGSLLFTTVEKAIGIPGIDPKVLESALARVLEAGPRAPLPPGALYAWARRLEMLDWWQWSIAFYDAAMNDGSGATNDHARHNSRFRGAAMRMDHLFQKEQASAAFAAILEHDPHGSFAEEAWQRLNALRYPSAPPGESGGSGG